MRRPLTEIARENVQSQHAPKPERLGDVGQLRADEDS